MDISTERKEIDSLIAGGESHKAASRVCALWDKNPGAPLAGFVNSVFEKIKHEITLTTHRCAVLRSFTVEPIIPILKAYAHASGINLQVHVGEFNAYAQEMLDGESQLYGFKPDTVILAIQTRDFGSSLQGNTSISAASDHVTEQFSTWIRAFRQHTSANLIIHSLEAPLIANAGIYDTQLAENQAATIHELNRNLRKLAKQHEGIYILDYDALVARHGRATWGDERKWLTVRLPISATNLPYMAHEWMRYLAPLTGKIAKVVAVDLDNTLWGGVIGEEGMAGIQVGPEYPGAAYQALQRALLDLVQRGILLAVCSKNNPQDALEALAGHPGILLRPESFAAMRINWNDKAQNLREIATELNVGLDAIAFLDDNPVERQHVREQAPEVTVVELPSDPMGYALAVRDHPAFERLVVVEEDRQRTHYYAAERQRTELAQSVSSREEFYRSLEQEAEIASVNSLTLARISQLTQKTNQFNLTTKRYTEQQISELAKHPDWRIWSISVKDRYADNGLVGIAITHDQGEACEIDTFLLSCRVIGRTVETTLLAHIAEEARSRGRRQIKGWFLPTKKNAPAKEFYSSHGFQIVEDSPAGQLWALDLALAELRYPSWMRVLATTAEKA